MDRDQRQLEQRHKYAAMPRLRKIAMLVLAVLAASVACLVVSYVLSGELRVGLSIAVGLAGQFQIHIEAP